MQIPVIKCHGSGNDFVLIDEYSGSLIEEALRPGLARSLCNRAGEIGADGVLFYLNSGKADVLMRMFNPDGTEASTCVNGLRCIARYGCEQLNVQRLSIEIGKGYVTGELIDPIASDVVTTSVDMGPISTNPADVPLVHDKTCVLAEPIQGLSDQLTFTALAAPNPQLVTVVQQIDEDELKRLGAVAESAPDFLPDRSNVSMVMKLDDKRMFVSTFERGAGITGSCGSAMASSVCAMCLLEHFDFGQRIQVVNRNGSVYCTPTQSDTGELFLNMHGNATYEFRADIDIDIANEKIATLQNKKIFTQEIAAYESLRKDAQQVIADHNIVLGPAAADAAAAGAVA